jgi:hypothetical protein
MPEAFFYGLVAAFTFIGFISVLYYILLFFFKPKGNGRYIITIPRDADRSTISNLIYGAHMRNLLFGDLVCDDIIILDCDFDDERRRLVKDLSNEYGGVRICTLDELKEGIERKEDNGAGTC